MLLIAGHRKDGCLVLGQTSLSRYTGACLYCNLLGSVHSPAHQVLSGVDCAPSLPILTPC